MYVVRHAPQCMFEGQRTTRGIHVSSYVDLNTCTGYQAWWQTPLPTDLSFQPYGLSFRSFNLLLKKVSYLHFILVSYSKQKLHILLFVMPHFLFHTHFVSGSALTPFSSSSNMQEKAGNKL